jgi:YjbE family integral membrane protein
MDIGYQHLVALVQVIMIDVALAGDNALVVGLAASQVARENRARVIFWGIAGAVLLRVVFAAVAVDVFAIVGMTLAGGLLLLWVCWKLARELRRSEVSASGMPDTVAQKVQPSMSFWGAVTQIVVADVSMSLDNVLAVAGAAKGSLVTLVAGLSLSVILMAVAATFISRLLTRYAWIGDAHGGHRLPELDKVTNSLRGDFVWLKSAQAFADQQASRITEAQCFWFLDVYMPRSGTTCRWGQP